MYVIKAFFARILQKFNYSFASDLALGVVLITVVKLNAKTKFIYQNNLEKHVVV